MSGNSKRQRQARREKQQEPIVPPALALAAPSYYDIDATVYDHEIDEDTSEDDMAELFYATLRAAEKGGAMDRFLVWARAVRASKGGEP